LSDKKFYTYTDLLNGGEALNTLNLTLAPFSAHVFEIKPR
jgi:hypothetical protein